MIFARFLGNGSKVKGQRVGTPPLPRRSGGMGSTSSAEAFCRAIEKGNEDEAMQILSKDSGFASSLRLGQQCKPASKHKANTALHYICKHALSDLLSLTLAAEEERHETRESKDVEKGYSLATAKVRIPSGKGPGQTFMATLPGGKMMRVRVPNTAVAGMTLSVSYKVPADSKEAGVQRFGGSGRADPNLPNMQKLTPLALLVGSPGRAEQRTKMLDELWRHGLKKNGVHLMLNRVDAQRRTALHSAAASGLDGCCFFLIDHGADLEAEDAKRQTPALLAESNGYTDLAARLEAITIFNPLHTQASNTVERKLGQVPRATSVTHCAFAGETDLSECLHGVVSSVAKSCSVDNATATALAAHYGWKAARAVARHRAGPAAACAKAGVPRDGRMRIDEVKRAGATCLTCGEGVDECSGGPGPSLGELETRILQMLQQGSGRADVFRAMRSQGHKMPAIMRALQVAQSVWFAAKQSSGKVNGEGKGEATRVTLRAMPCGHCFCEPCWSKYLEVKISDGETNICCPGPDCALRVAPALVSALSTGTRERFRRFRLRNFVDQRDDIKWCPHPGCAGAVRRLRRGRHVGKIGDCGRGHAFCFECGEAAHDPATCAQVAEWRKLTARLRSEMKDKVGKGSGKSDQKMDLATLVWIGKNTRPCPGCSSAIQKNEGCNHMTCRKCRHEFCWICMGPWSKHGSRTGGFYKCNVYKGPGPSDNKSANAQLKTTAAQTERMVHFLSRFQAHFASSGLEQKMVEGAARRMEEMQKATVDHVRTRFVETAFRELFMNRVTLCGAYIYRYFLSEQQPKAASAAKAPGGSAGGISRLFGHIRAGLSRVRDLGSYMAGSISRDPRAFDQLHAEMERKTEALSNVIARKRWRATRASVLRLTLEAVQAREALLKFVEDYTKLPDLEQLERERAEAKRTASRAVQRRRTPSPRGSAREAVEWACPRCTYLNQLTRNRCEMCNGERPNSVEGSNCSIM